MRATEHRDTRPAAQRAAKAPARAAGSVRSGAGALLHLQRTAGNAAVATLFRERDRLHDPLLDAYARDSGLPREQVTQHDQGYRAWLQRPRGPGPVNLSVAMSLPVAAPPPDYSRTEQQLGAWERANAVANVQIAFACAQVFSGATEWSFVTDVSFEMRRSVLELFIARHIRDNMTDVARQTGERITWRHIHERVRTHGHVHFDRYRQVVDTLRPVYTARLASLPDWRRPVPISRADLEAYLLQLLLHLRERLAFELWRTTCEWERIDYPRVLAGIPNVSARLQVNCSPAPVVRPEPVLPVVVRGRTP